MMNMMNMMNNEINMALCNSGYRFFAQNNSVHAQNNGVYIFCKPIGFGILRADFHPNDMKIEISLIVKGNADVDGKQPNLIWNRYSHNISADNDMYLNCVQIIKDCEAEIFIQSPIANEMNRFVRYDFKETPME